MERMIFNMHRQTLVGRIEARSLGYRPAFKGAIQFKAEIVMQMRRVVLLDQIPKRVRVVTCDLACLFLRQLEVTLRMIAIERRFAGGCACHAWTKPSPRAARSRRRLHRRRRSYNWRRWRPTEHKSKPIRPAGRVGLRSFGCRTFPISPCWRHLKLAGVSRSDRVQHRTRECPWVQAAWRAI